MNKLLNKLIADKPILQSPLHGLNHYHNVYEAGLDIGTHYKADLKVIKYFAYLHDCCRLNEDTDPQHGKRAAQWIRHNLEFIKLNSSQIELLLRACEMHTYAKPYYEDTYDITIQCCFDADRSDIGRVGLQVDPSYLFTDYAKENYVY
tara:strand:+ start:1000 stop:1443 length:444 start_codon:yes stop_codon:yes gene_type:complete